MKSRKFIIVFMVYIMFRVDKLLDQIFVSRFYGQLQAALPILRFFRLLIMGKIFIFSIFFFLKIGFTDIFLSMATSSAG